MRRFLAGLGLFFVTSAPACARPTSTPPATAPATATGSAPSALAESVPGPHDTGTAASSSDEGGVQRTSPERGAVAHRDNGESASRSVSAGADAAAEVRAPLPCNKAHPSADAMCACLVAQKDAVMTMFDAPPKCTKAKTAAPLGDGRLGVFVWGGDEMGETIHVLAVREGASTRPLADLGRDYEPGAFGVHNEAVVKGGESRNVGGHTVVVLRSEQNDNDFNMAGLELCTHHTKLETVCALGDAPGSSRCTPPIPVETKAGCGLGVEPDPSELDASVRAALAEVKKRATSARATASWTITEDGQVTVRFVSGTKELVPKNVLRAHALW